MRHVGPRANGRGALRRAGFLTGGLTVWMLAAQPAAAAAKASGFCPALRSIVADAPDAFEAVRGAKVGYVPEDGGGDDSTRYVATRSLPGARGCGVDRNRSDGEDLLSTYVCWFDAPDGGSAAVKRLAGEIGDCLGRAAGDQIAVSARGATADMRRKPFALSLEAPARGGPAVLEIGQR